jgi:hypothetical protein
MIPSQIVHDMCRNSPSLRVTVGTMKKIMDHPTPETVWLELWPFYTMLTVADIKAVWTSEQPVRPQGKPARWPLRLLTRKSTLP